MVQRWYHNTLLQLTTRGFLVSLPMIIFLALTYLFFGVLFGVLNPLSEFLSPNAEQIPWIVHLLSFLLIISVFSILGFFISKERGRQRFTRFEDGYLAQIPIYSTIRDTVKQFTGLSEMPFSQVVLVDPFGTGVMLTGFITERISPDMYTIFVPTAPNPTNGNIYHVPHSKLVFLNVRPDEALRTIVGMGTGSSYLFPDKKMVRMSTDTIVDPVQVDLK